MYVWKTLLEDTKKPQMLTQPRVKWKLTLRISHNSHCRDFELLFSSLSYISFEGDTPLQFNINWNYVRALFPSMKITSVLILLYYINFAFINTYDGIKL